MSAQKNKYDHVYLINRDIATKRLASASGQLDAAGIEFERFAAVNGADVEIIKAVNNQSYSGRWYQDNKIKTELNVLYDINCNSAKYPDFSYQIYSKFYSFVAGELGLWCSNLALWQDALAHNYKTIVVFQDDIKILNPKKFNDQLNNFISQLPASFDIAFIDIQMKGVALTKMVNPFVDKMADNCGRAVGAWAMVYNAKALEKVHNFSPFVGNDDRVFINHRARVKEKTTDHNFEVYISSVDMIDVMGQSEMGRFEL